MQMKYPGQLRFTYVNMKILMNLMMWQLPYEIGWFLKDATLEV